MSDIIVYNPQNAFLPMLSVQEAISRRDALKEYVKGLLRQGIDFGVIPGTQEQTLLKPGAEKLCTVFGLAPRFEIVRSVEDWTGADHGGEPFFYYMYRCQLWRGDMVIAEADGSCNSWEKKYRYRSSERTCPACNKPTIFKSKDRTEWFCWVKKGGCGATFELGVPGIVNQQVGQVPNPDIADVVNTLQKMAQKRAMIGACLLAVNASEFFTQDVEDYASTETVQPGRRRQTPAQSQNSDQAPAEGRRAATSGPMPINDSETACPACHAPTGKRHGSGCTAVTQEVAA